MGDNSIAMRQPKLNLGSSEPKYANDLSAHLRYAGRAKTLSDRRMAKKKRYLTATMSDGYVKTIGPTAAPFTHYWRIVAEIEGRRPEVFWGHARSFREASGKTTAAREAATQRGWTSYAFEIVALTETHA